MRKKREIMIKSRVSLIQVNSFKIFILTRIAREIPRYLVMMRMSIKTCIEIQGITNEQCPILIGKRQMQKEDKSSFGIRPNNQLLMLNQLR